MHASQWQAVGPAETVPEGAAKEVVVGGNAIAIFRHEGQLFALDAMCAHQGGPIAQGAVAEGCVTCPWHGWQYELATGKQTIHNQKLLETHEVKEEEGTLWVRLGEGGSPR